MSDRPTFWDYLLSCNGNVIKTHSGRYFWFDKDSRKRFWLTRIAFFLFVMAFNTVIYLTNRISLPQNSIFDVAFLLLFLLWPVLRLVYKATRFEELEPGSANAEEACTWRYYPIIRKTAFSALAALSVFCLLNSYTALAIRSAVENAPRIHSIEFQAGDESVHMEAGAYKGDNVVELTRHQSKGTVNIHVTTAGTTYHAELSLDGRQIELEPWRKYMSWFWERDYSFCEYFGAIRVSNNIRDGSVLTLNCGSLTREWVFDVTNKEAS